MSGSALTRLNERSLVRLSDALRSGLLKTPFSRLTLSRLVPIEFLDSIVEDLRQHESQGLTSSLLLVLVEALLQQRTELLSENPQLELVMTGPEPPGSFTRDTGVVVRQMFTNATHSIFLCGFAVYQGKEIFSALAKRMQAVPAMNVSMCLNIERPHGDHTPSEVLVARFRKRFRETQWPDNVDLPEIFFDPRTLEDSGSGKSACLHAKFVIADQQQVFLSSANFTEAAQQRNIEAGVRTDNAALARDLSTHFQSLIDNGDLKKLP
ncbi:MAG: DISARM system phospholipase D-like protein DrmC [Fuerstiella sp.]